MVSEKIHKLLLKLDEDLQELDSLVNIDIDEYESKRIDIYVDFSWEVEQANGVCDGK